MPLAAALALLALLWATASPALAAEPKAPLFAALGIETVDGRQGAVAAPLTDGRVLIAGGSDNLALRSAEIFDPVEIAFEPVPNLTRYARSRATAAPLPDGRVLIAGGANEVLYAHAEVFDPETEKFTDVEDEMTTGRIKGVAAALPDGRVLIAGGYAEGETLNSAEVFDPVTETFSALNATMWRGRSGAIGVDLPSGKVLITGGSGESEAARSTEVFDPVTETFSALNPEAPDESSLAVGAALADGQVLIAGGIAGGIPRRWSGLLDPGSGSFSFMPKEGGTQLTTERADAIAARLPDGKVLISGGSWPEARSSAEIFVPAAALRGVGGQFGIRVIGEEAAPVTVVVTSLGGWSLEIDAVSLSGADAADFSILADTCTGARLSFGETCTLSVRFTPARLGVAQAFLDFDDNELSPTPVPLTATGVAPFVPELPVVDRPVPPDPRFATSVRCAAKPLANPRRAKVTCRFSLAPGAWEARLLHAGRMLIRRQVEGGRQRLTFKLVRRLHGAYRLQLVPLPQ
ncbi:MAG TPA: hypothetical protein VN752_08105 [Solirubrobacterales bacterium]|nr:hypothetical protein [Solirubrobacterales bacterium]